MQTLITGTSGEVGYGLINNLANDGHKIIALDIKQPSDEILSKIDKFYLCDITDKSQVEKIFNENNIGQIFHLAALLSTGSERNPHLAIDVNVNGTVNLLESSTVHGLKNDKSIKFIFPSSIAAYGLPSLKTKIEKGEVSESEFLDPITIYGVTKLASENIGKYYSTHYRLLEEIDRNNLVDFRCVRFPGLLSPDTLPTGGTSDYGPEMIHAAAQGKKYNCFVRDSSIIPFMAMSDAIEVLLKISSAPKENLKHNVYNVASFSATTTDIFEMTKEFFPDFEMSYEINEERQKIIDSWPKALDDSNARNDWGWNPKLNFKETFSEYLIPKIKQRYRKS